MMFLAFSAAALEWKARNNALEFDQRVIVCNRGLLNCAIVCNFVKWHKP